MIFKDIIDKINMASSYRLYSMKTKTQSKKVYIHDKKTEKLISEKLIQTLQSKADLEILEYDILEHEKCSIERIDLSQLSWAEMEDAINNLQITNNNIKAEPELINKECQVDILELRLENQKIYLLMKHANLSAAFKNRIIINNRKLLNVNKMVVFSEYVDAIILGEYCYILNERNFNIIFKFREKINKEIENNKDDFLGLEFLDNSDLFFDICNKNLRTKNALMKIINTNAIEYLKRAKNIEIKSKLEKYNELKGVMEFEPNSYKLIVNKDSAIALLKILTNKIGVNILTDDIFGTDKEVNDG